MSEQSSQPEQQPPTEIKSDAEILWDNQRRLVAAIQKATSPQAKDSLGNELNRNVADLVEAGQMSAKDAWPLSYGENPYIDPAEDLEDEE